MTDLRTALSEDLSLPSEFRTGWRGGGGLTVGRAKPLLGRLRPNLRLPMPKFGLTEYKFGLSCTKFGRTCQKFGTNSATFGGPIRSSAIRSKKFGRAGRGSDATVTRDGPRGEEPGLRC